MRLVFGLIFLSTSISVYSQKLTLKTIDCSISNKDVNYIQKIAKYQAKLYNNFFNTNANDSLELKITLYGNRGDYTYVQKLVNPGMHKTLGFYLPSTDSAYVFKGADYTSTIIHEASHCFLENNLPRTPRWLTEGIAAFCETLTIENNEVVFSAQAARIRSVRNMVLAADFKLMRFLDTRSSSWGEKNATQNLYSISYSLIYFLIKKNPNALKQILMFMKEGHSAEKAIEYGYGGFYRFESDYINFYKNSLIKPV